jgi:DNA-binding XRE family transcriptional regulator
MKWENNIKSDVKELRLEGEYWIHLIQDAVQWLAQAKNIIALRFHRGRRIFWTSERMLALKGELSSNELVTFCISHCITFSLHRHIHQFTYIYIYSYIHILLFCLIYGTASSLLDFVQNKMAVLQWEIKVQVALHFRVSTRAIFSIINESCVLKTYKSKK